METRPLISGTSKRIPELDGVRGLAILLVILYHYVAVPTPADASVGYQVLRQVFSNGWSGVDLFFVLSGFLITGILIDHRQTKNYFKVFYFRRTARIFPLYYFFLFLFLLLQYFESQGGLLSGVLFFNELPLAPYFLYLQNFSMAVRGSFGNEFLAMTWSLAIEEQFYLFLPLIVRRTLPERLPLTIIFFISIPLLLRATLGGGSFYGFVLTPWRLDALFLGGLLAVIIRSPRVFEALRTHLRWLRATFLVLLLFMVFSSLTEELGSLDHFFIFGVLYATLILLPLADKKGLLARIFRWSALRNLGFISYGIYLFHQMVNGVLHEMFFQSLPSFHDAASIGVTVLAFLVTCLLAMATYHAFEKRFVALGHRYRYAAG